MKGVKSPHKIIVFGECTECNATNLNFLLSTVFEKHQEKCQKMVILKNQTILAVFIIFVGKVPSKVLSFLALQSVHQDGYFELSKTSLKHFFIHRVAIEV